VDFFEAERFLKGDAPGFCVDDEAEIADEEDALLDPAYLWSSGVSFGRMVWAMTSEPLAVGWMPSP
jgi:hypothetical protein